MYIKLTTWTTSNLLETQIIKPHRRPTESENLGMKSNNILTSTSEDFDAY